MHTPLPIPIAALELVWLPGSTLVAGALLGWLLAGRKARKLLDELRLALERRLQKERERAELAEREVAAVRSSAARSDLSPVIEALAVSAKAFDEAGDARQVAKALEAGIGAAFACRQRLVFLVAREEGEFLLAASGGSQDPGWTEGGRIDLETGRLGLAAKRGRALTVTDFETESVHVRNHLTKTEPEKFLIEVAVPVRVGERTVALVSAGGSRQPLPVMCRGVELLCSLAAAAFRRLDAQARADLAMHLDETTRLGNKTWFRAEGEALLLRTRLERQPSALLLVGVDALRTYVERNGHAAGDKLLRGMGALLRPFCREGELCARWSGAEFVLLLPRAELPAAAALAERVRAAVAAVEWPGGEGQPTGCITVSCGIAAHPDEATSLEQLVAEATGHLTAVRAAGGDGVASSLGLRCGA